MTIQGRRVPNLDVVRSLIYPIPDPDLPFLGIHLTRMIDGGVTVGPNAVLGFAREGYRKGSMNGRDIATFVSSATRNPSAAIFFG